jgi:hypothetical protein
MPSDVEMVPAPELGRVTVASSRNRSRWRRRNRAMAPSRDTYAAHALRYGSKRLTALPSGELSPTVYDTL